MGCDIHLHTEIKLNGKWEHYSTCRVDRCYALFAKMADVRNNGEIKPISKPKGLPLDATAITQFDYSVVGEGDAHSASWLSVTEVIKLCKWVKNERQLNWFKTEDAWGYLFGNNWESFKKYPEDYPQEVEDFRFVFWFDN